MLKAEGEGKKKKKKKNSLVWFGYCFTPTDTKAHYGLLTPANQLMVIIRGLKYGHCPILVRTSDLLIIGPRAYQLL
jgi:meiotically up-regulated gene 157 (Mug157) protein